MVSYLIDIYNIYIMRRGKTHLLRFLLFLKQYTITLNRKKWHWILKNKKVGNGSLIMQKKNCIFINKKNHTLLQVLFSE